jgi:CBS domain-containing membrane protein
MMLGKLLTLAGVQADGQGHREKAIAAAGGLLGVLLVSTVSHWFLSGAEAAMVVASMGATAVLVFAVPHGPMSQPWPVIGGHLLSALIGVTCAQFLPGVILSSAVAVGLAIWVMYELGCLHPPGGATALAAVVGGEQILSLGYGFLLTPVLLNVAVIVTAAVLFNLLFSWRRYPAALFPRRIDLPSGAGPIRHQDLVFAIREVGSFVDASEADLAEIYELARRHAEGGHLSPDDIVEAGAYTNGSSGRDDAVRLVLKVDLKETGEADVRFRLVKGEGAPREGTCSRQAMAVWARRRVNDGAGQELSQGHESCLSRE